MSDSKDPQDNAATDENADGEEGYSSDEGYRSLAALAAQSKAKRVVFSDYIAYSPIIMWLLLVAPATMLGSVLLVSLDADQPPAERDSAIKILCWTTVGIILLYIFILPYRVNVMADGSVGIRVIPFTYNFGDIVRAYTSPGMFDDVYRPRLKFATNLDKRVVVMRRKEKWDITVSPCNPEEFVDALDSVVNVEGGLKEAVVPTGQSHEALSQFV